MAKEPKLFHLLDLIPDKALEFSYNMGEPSQTELTIKNRTEYTVAFKIKTNAPKEYIVRPNQGILSENQRRDVTITLQPLKDSSTEIDHKFLIQATLVKNQESSTFNEQKLKELWMKTEKALIDQYRLRVVMRMNDEEDNAHSKSPAHQRDEEATLFKTVHQNQNEFKESENNELIILQTKQDKIMGEYTKIKQENETLKKEIEKMKDAKELYDQKKFAVTEQVSGTKEGYQLLHLIVVGIIFLMIGAYLAS